MRLKSLEVFGFKSFLDKTVVTFQPGITAIVGPNGCGKSNLADAILWVLGEQSPKTLRGERMEDVIFNGTELRKPLGMAEVSLMFGDIANELPPPYSPYSEITVSRRLFRSGESEYLINKTPCRLKDIRDLLIDTGAGYRAHTIIEQGKVDHLISASPLQRREIVEEAAGIAKYRLRKMEALRKLESTEQNLTRVRDIIGEIKRQIHSLDRQARKAEKYQKMKEELKSIELQIASVEWNRWNQVRKRLEEEEEALQETAIRQENQQVLLDLQHAEMRLSLTQKEQELGGIKNQVFEVEGKIHRLEGKIEIVHAQRKEWNETSSRNHQEMGEIRQAESALIQEDETLDQEQAEIERTLPEHEHLLLHWQEEADQLERHLIQEMADLEREKVALFELASDVTQLRNNLVHIELRKDELLKKRGRGNLELEEIQRKKEASEETIKKLQEQWEETKHRFAEQSAAHTAATSFLKETESVLKTKLARLSQVREEWAAASGRLASREGFYRGLLGRQEGVENLLLQLEGLHGMIADLIEVPTLYEKGIEAILENRLRGIVVEGHREIKKGVEHLRHSQVGRGTFFPRWPRLFKQKRSGPLQGEGVIGHAIDLVSCRHGYEAIGEVLLGDVILVRDLDAALRLWSSSELPRTWVTLEGEVIDPSGIVSGGEQGDAGLLGQKREIKSLSDQISELQTEMRLLEAEVEQNQQISQSTQTQIEALAAEIRSLEIQQLNEQKDHTALLAEMDRLQNALQTILFEQEEGTQEERDILKIEQTEKNQMLETQRLKEEKEAVLNQKQGKLDETRRTLESLKEKMVQSKMEIASLKERQSHLVEKSHRIGRAKEELVQRFQEKERLMATLQERLKTGEIEEAEMVSAIQQHAAERERLLNRIREKTEAHAAVLAELQHVEQETQTLRAENDQTQKALQEKALGKIEAQLNQGKIQETILMNYQVEIASNPLPEGRFPTDGEIGEIREKAATLRRLLEEMGPVNIGAIEEYRELETRYQFLTAQETDLTTSMESLRQAIAKINRTTQNLFIDTFHHLNQKFNEVFVSFFSGGKAELVLVDEAHPLESGIEMIAQPPGKKPRSITLLSGGEKALTAISLLFATFLIHPSPFCLLDEIDAPLDDENTRRFTQALAEMSRQTQFIIVTHNKLTMEIADLLYGVTMEETGISKLVSVHFNDQTPSNGHPAEMPVTSDSA